MRFICRVLLLKPPNYLTRVHSFKSVNVQWMLNPSLICFQLNESKALLKHVLQTSWKSSFINRFSYLCVCVLFFCLLCSIQKDFFFLFQWDFSTKYYSYLALNLRLAFCLSVASWNNILVLPECSLKTPASVILLQAVIPPLQDSSFCIFSNNLLLFYLVFISLHTQKKKKLYSYNSTPGFIIKTYLKYSSHDFKSWWISLPIIV